MVGVESWAEIRRMREVEHRSIREIRDWVASVITRQPAIEGPHSARYSGGHCAPSGSRAVPLIL